MFFLFCFFPSGSMSNCFVVFFSLLDPIWSVVSKRAHLISQSTVIFDFSLIFLFLCFKSTVNICLSERPPQFAPWVIFHCRPPPNFSLHLQTLSNRSNHTALIALNHHLELRHQPSHQHAMFFKSRCKSNFVYQIHSLVCTHNPIENVKFHSTIESCKNVLVTSLHI